MGIIYRYILVVFLCNPIFAQNPVEQLREFGGKEELAMPLMAPQLKNEDFSAIEKLRQYIDRGLNLKEQCEIKSEISFAEPIQMRNAKQSILATLQYYGLLKTGQLIARNFREQDIDEDQFSKTVDQLIGQSCSKNISVIGPKKLKETYLKFFKDSESYHRPTYIGKSGFPQNAGRYMPISQASKREFYFSLILFQAFCSWDGDVDNLRLMVPIVQTPFVYAELMSLILGEVVDSTFPGKMSCINSICRKSEEPLPKSIGYVNQKIDLERLYCQEFKNVDYKFKGQNPEILKIIKKTTFDDQNLMINMMSSLIVGTTDLFLWSDSPKDLAKLLAMPIDWTWNSWADRRLDQLKNFLTFEEPLVVELVEPSPQVAGFEVGLDVNVGEFDRMLEGKGKLGLTYSFKLKNSLLVWARKQLSLKGEELVEAMPEIKKALTSRISFWLDKMRQNLDIPVWGGDPSPLIASGLIEQLGEARAEKLLKSGREDQSIKIILNFSPFAMRYISFVHQVRELESSERRWENWQRRFSDDKMAKQSGE